MSRNIVFLINPISGTGNKKLLPELIDRKFRGAGIAYRILPTEKSGDYSRLRSMIADEGITDIIICGGDGSVNNIIGFLAGADVSFGIIPLGSGNGLALGAGIPVNPSRAIDLVIKGNSMITDAFSINGKFSCMLAGLGFDARVAHDFAARKKRGLMTYISESLKTFISCKPYPFIVDAGKVRIHTEAYFISMANSNQFGNHVTIAPKASLSDGLLDIVIVNKMNKVRMVFALMKQILSGKVNPEWASQTNKGINYFHTPEIHIKNPLEAPLHIDGEPVETFSDIHVKIIPGAFRLIVP